MFVWPDIFDDWIRALARILKLPFILERVHVKISSQCCQSDPSRTRSTAHHHGWGPRARPQGPWWGPGATPWRASRGQSPWKRWGLTYFKCLRRPLLCFYQYPVNMHIYDKKRQILDWLCGGKVQKWQNWLPYVQFWNKLIVLDIILCWFLLYHAATNHMDGNWKINANVIHFLSFAGMLQVIFGIFSPSSHFCQARQKRKLFLEMTG